MHCLSRPFRTAFVVPLAAACLLAGCASDGESSAEFRLMDAPPPGVTSVKIHVLAIHAHVDDKSAKDADPTDAKIDDSAKWVVLGVGRTIDLVAHQGESAADVLGKLNLPDGKITQIRLVVDTIKAGTATFNGKDCALDMTKVAKKGIKINHVFKAFETGVEKHHIVWVDFELDNSMKDDKKGCFELEPKLKLHKVKRDGVDVAL